MRVVLGRMADRWPGGAAKPVIAVGCLLLTGLCAACGLSAPSASSTQPAASTAVPAGAATVPAPATAPPIRASARAARCPEYPAAIYGVDPNQVADTGGGAQLVTVVAHSKASLAGTFVAQATKVPARLAFE